MAPSAQDAVAMIEAARVDPAVYGDADIFELEMTHIFDRAWLLVGHESQIPSPGDYVLERAGRHPIILWRGQDGTIQGFLNRCPHRGARLCSRQRGNASSLVCPYHGWVFDAAGALKSLPAPSEYGAGFDFADWGMRPVAALDSYRGFIFVRHTAEGPALRDFLGEMVSSIDDMIDRSPDSEIEVCAVPLRHRYRGNWKLSFENLNDAHHARVAHNATVRAATRVMRKKDGGSPHTSLQIMQANGMPIEQFSQLKMATSDYGHSFIHGFIDQQNPTRGLPDDYLAAMKASHGEAETDRILSVDRHLTLLYPGATLQGRFQTMRLIQPLAPDLTEVVGFLFRLKGAPDPLFRQALHYFHISISPFSPVATDDFDIYEGAQVANGSSLARHMPLMRGLNGSGSADRENQHQATSEVFIRNQYAAWKKYISAAGAG